MTDPVRQFEHSHANLTRLAFEVRDMVRAGPGGQAAPDTRGRLLAGLEVLREELLRHFANEEEGLFPFVRQNVPQKASVVDRLQDAHDTICGSLVRLTHLVEHVKPEGLDATRPALVALHERFEKAYAAHSQEETVLFEGLGRTLDHRQRGALAEILQGL